MRNPLTSPHGTSNPTHEVSHEWDLPPDKDASLATDLRTAGFDKISAQPKRIVASDECRTFGQAVARTPPRTSLA